MSNNIPTKIGEKYIYLGNVITRPPVTQHDKRPALHFGSIIRIDSLRSFPAKNGSHNYYYHFTDSAGLFWILNIDDVKPLKEINWIKKSIYKSNE